MDTQLCLRQSTSLVITSQLQQAIQFLQLPYHELETILQTHLEKNPFLISEDGELESDYALDGGSESLSFGTDNFLSSIRGTSSSEQREDFSFLSDSLSLRDVIAQQVNSQMTSELERRVGLHLIQFIQPTGYFEGPLDMIAGKLCVPIERVQRVLKKMQQFDPPGICARTLQECLRVQLADKNLLTPPYEALLSNLDCVVKGDLKSLSRKCKVSIKAIQEMLQEIRRLSPKPGLIFQNETSCPMKPEVLVQRIQDKWAVTLNPDTTPKILLNNGYYASVRSQSARIPERRYLSEQMNHAHWLIKALHQRSMTLLRVSVEIVRRQQGFFEHGVSSLEPLVLQDVAQELGIHESTVSRVSTQKYMATPRGIFELSYFFTSHLECQNGTRISAESARQQIRELILNERPSRPLSDEAITLELQTQGIHIARRTVAKYRELLKFPPAFQRRRQHYLGLPPR